MALKIVEAHVPPDLASEAEAALRELSKETWREQRGRFGGVVSCIIGADHTGAVLDRLHERPAERRPRPCGRARRLARPFGVEVRVR